MATVTKPIALDESLNTTELSSRNVADVLAQELSAVATAIGGISAPSAEDVSYDNSGSGLSATDVQNALDELSAEKIGIFANAGFHNSIYRGKYLGDHVTPEQWASIVAGTFDDLFIGDYWTINSVNWRIAHFDYWLGTGDTECTDHHVVIVPDTNLYMAKMNSTDITTGGYYNSEMRGGANYLVNGSSNLYSASETIKSAFGSSHILTHREVLTNAVSSGNASGWAWYDSSVDLMSEVMVYGTLAWSNGGKGYEVGDGKVQLALFRHDISKATNRTRWWLRGVYSAAYFALVNTYGYANYYNASASAGVRPAFAIK